MFTRPQWGETVTVDPLPAPDPEPVPSVTEAAKALLASMDRSALYVSDRVRCASGALRAALAAEGDED